MLYQWTFVFINYFTFSATEYSYLFALNVLGIIVFTFFNARFVKQVQIQATLFVGTSLATASGFLMFLAHWLYFTDVLAIAIPVFFFVSMTGFVGANCVAELLRLFRNSAGVATATFTICSFGLGSIASFLTGCFHDGTPVTMSLVMFVCGISAFLSLFLTTRPVNSHEATQHSKL